MSRGHGRRHLRRQAKTVLLVGEGHSEDAFLRYIRGLYAPRNCGVVVTISNAHGKGPAHIIDHTIGQMRAPKDYSITAAVLDNDLDCPGSHLQKARSNRIALIWSSPCFEALLLEILEQHVPSRTQHCKAKFATTYGIDLVRPDAYAALFPKDRLDRMRSQVANLNAICRAMEGASPNVSILGRLGGSHPGSASTR